MKFLQEPRISYPILNTMYRDADVEVCVVRPEYLDTALLRKYPLGEKATKNVIRFRIILIE